MPDLPPPSPCVNICVLDANGRCQGCYRTIEEIASWPRLTAAEQWAVLRSLNQRAALKEASGES